MEWFFKDPFYTEYLKGFGPSPKFGRDIILMSYNVALRWIDFYTRYSEGNMMPDAKQEALNFFRSGMHAGYRGDQRRQTAEDLNYLLYVHGYEFGRSAAEGA